MFEKKYFLFDILYLLFSALIYIPSLALSVWVGKFLWADSLHAQILSLSASFFLFIHAFTFFSAVPRLFLPKLKTGICRIGLNKDYFSFALNTALHAVMFTSPLFNIVHLIFYLKFIYYRLMGMKLSSSALLGMHTIVRQPELIEIAEGSIVGIGASLSCHVTATGKSHYQGKIIIGKNCVIGGYAVLGPGVVVGDETIVGGKSTIYSYVTIGRNVKIGIESSIQIHAKIPDNVTIKPCSVVTSAMKMKEGETWGGNPAILISDKSSKQKKEESSDGS